MEGGLDRKFDGELACFQNLATIETLEVLRIVIFSDQPLAFVFAHRIGHEVLSDEAVRSIALAASGRDGNGFRGAAGP